MVENSRKDPTIKLFGKKIPLPTDDDSPAISGEDLASLEIEEEKAEKVQICTVKNMYIESVLYGNLKMTHLLES